MWNCDAFLITSLKLTTFSWINKNHPWKKFYCRTL